jgi:succinate-semialdehyde dehydrogenase
MRDIVEIKEMIKRSRVALKQYEDYDQHGVDSIVKELARIVFFKADELARMAYEETRMGGYEYKVRKHLSKARTIWNDLRTKKSVGIINRDEKTGIVEIAKPVGVVGAVTPCTNPIVTVMSNAMFALKGRNTIIISPHPRAAKCVSYLVELYRDAITKLGATADLIQCISDPSIENTKELMKAVDVVVATGGMDMVRSAYSSGKPSFGVGAGNVQCIVDMGVDIPETVNKIIDGRTFDNGIICSGEQSVIIPDKIFVKVVNEFEKQGCRYVDDKEEKKRLEQLLFPGGKINRHMIGQPVEVIADTANIAVSPGTKMILVLEEKDDGESIFRREKMFPVAAVYAYSVFSEAVDIALENLNVEGKGHSVAIHSNNTEHVELLALRAPVSRVVVNAPGSTTLGGSFFNGFAPTTTLGCGSWGNNSISENLTYKHLLNITRIGYLRPDNPIPTDEELWG